MNYFAAVIFSVLILLSVGVFAQNAAPVPGGTASAAVAASPCTDVSKFDLKDATVSVKDGEALATDGKSGDAIPFKNGIAEIKDSPTAQTPDWHYEITGDFIMEPMRNTKLRIVKIFENHLNGAGSWDRVMIFRCHNDQLDKIFQLRTAAQASVKQVNELQFKITGTPKTAEMGLYQWDARHITFVRRHG